MKNADKSIVFYNPQTIKHKNLEMINPDFVKKCFGDGNIKIINEKKIT